MDPYRPMVYAGYALSGFLFLCGIVIATGIFMPPTMPQKFRIMFGIVMLLYGIYCFAPLTRAGVPRAPWRRPSFGKRSFRISKVLPSSNNAGVWHQIHRKLGEAVAHNTVFRENADEPQSAAVLEAARPGGWLPGIIALLYITSR